VSRLLCYTEVRSAFSIEQSFNAAEKPTNLVEVNSKGEATIPANFVSGRGSLWASTYSANVPTLCFCTETVQRILVAQKLHFCPTTALLSCPQDVVVSVPDSHAWRESGIFGIS